MATQEDPLRSSEPDHSGSAGREQASALSVNFTRSGCAFSMHCEKVDSTHKEHGTISLPACRHS